MKNKLVSILLLLVCLSTGKPEYNIYLPAILNKPKIIGVEIWPGNSYASYLNNKVDIVRRSYVRWNLFVTDRENFLSLLDSDISKVPANTEIILIFFGSPDYARPESTQECYPFYKEYLPEFLEFISFIVTRYKDRIRYYEIWNEQDSESGETFHYGCWGVKNAKYYGEVYTQARTTIKQINPNSKALFGSFMNYSTDNTIGFIASSEVRDADIYGIHYYVTHPKKVDIDKLNREIDKICTFTNTDVWITETNLLCDGNCTADYQQAKKEFAKSILSVNSPVILFYALTTEPSWKYAALLDKDGKPLPIHDYLFAP